MTACRCFTTYNNEIARDLKNEVMISDPISTRLNGKSDKVPLKFKAIWDTGATNTVITNKIVTDCKLSPINMQQVYTPSGGHIANVYVIDLWLPNGIVIPNLQVTEGILTTSDLLIGMDIIALGDFSVSNFNGKTTFTFRIPSIVTTDYVALANATIPKIAVKIGVNDLCPCGSGKKYKKCHGNI